MRATRIAQRGLATLVLSLGIAVFVFVFMRAIPGDPVDLIMGREGGVSREQVERLRAEYGLDQPLHLQLARYLYGLARGDWGLSFVRQQPVAALIAERFPATIELAFGALVFALAAGLPIGVFSAVRRGSAADRLAMAAAFVGISLPGFWLGVVLMLLLSVQLGWFPVAGRFAAGWAPTHLTGFYLLDSLLSADLEAFGIALRHLALPAVTLGAPMAAIVARLTRSSLLEVLGQDYVRTARAKGLRERVVLVRHALRNALLPTVTLVGLELGTLLGGNMIVETVFEWPGLGRLVVEAIFARDYPLVQAAVMVYAVTFAVANLLVDVVYTFLNPRIAL